MKDSVVTTGASVRADESLHNVDDAREDFLTRMWQQMFHVASQEHIRVTLE